MKKFDNHTFVICAYKKSLFLEECIISLLSQSLKSNIIMVTSTPNDYIENLSRKYKLPLFINTKKSGIGEDWNFGVSMATTDYVTIAHQDDIYNKDYLENIVHALNKKKNFVIAFTKYNEIKKGSIIPLTKNLKIKELLLFPLKFFKKSKFIKKLTLSFGNAICCPSVTLNKKIVGDKPFLTNLKCNLDWETWLYFTNYKGKFIYIPKYLMCHRIHENSETSNLIENNVRLEEDLYMLKKLWPEFIAKLICFKYKKAINTNKMEV